MAANRYDRVDFRSWCPTTKRQEVVCQVNLIKGKLVYSGPKAKHIKKMVEEDSRLKPFRDIGGYTLLAELCQVYRGDYFYATQVIDASLF